MEKEKIIVLSVIVVIALIFVSVAVFTLLKSPTEREKALSQQPAASPEGNPPVNTQPETLPAEEQNPTLPDTIKLGEELSPAQKQKLLNNMCSYLKKEGKELLESCK